MADKTVIKAVVDSNLASAKAGGILATDHREVLNDNFLEAESTTRTGSTLLFNTPFGAIYNAASPLNASTITLNPAGALVGAVVAFYSDGSVEPSVTPTPVPKAGGWVAGQVNVYWFMWDGANFSQNIQVQVLPTLADPTYSLAAGAALELDYSFLTADSAAAGGVFQIATQSDFSDAESVAGYTFGVDGSITTFGGSALTAITYYTRLQSTAANYNASAFSEQSATATAMPTLSTPTLAMVAAPTQVTFNVSAEDAVADGGVLEYSVNAGSTWTAVPSYVFATKTTVLTGLTNGVNVLGRFLNTKSGYTNSAYATDNATPTSLTNTKSAIFNGTNRELSFSQSALSFTSGGGVDLPFSASFWVKDIPNLGATTVIFSSYVGADQSILIYMYNSSIRLALHTTATSLMSNVSQTIDTTNWKHIAITYDGSKTNAGIKIYGDSVLLTNTTYNPGTYTGLPAFTTDKQTWGRRGATPSYFTGNIDEGALFDKVLSLAEVVSITNGGTPNDLTTLPFAGNLVLYNRFEDNGNDSSTNAFASTVNTLTYSNDTP